MPRDRQSELLVSQNPAQGIPWPVPEEQSGGFEIDRMFRDRKDAGRQLARALRLYRGQDAVVLAIPRGGVEIGYEVATYLDAEFSILVTRKLPLPHNPEAGFGAIAEDGSRFIYPGAASALPPAIIDEIVAQQKAEIARRVRVLRDGRPLPEITQRRVILVDDGIAMGSTMRASIAMCKNRGAAELVVAVPVAGRRVAHAIDTLADRLVILTTPHGFRAVAQVYEHWRDVPDREVLAILDRWHKQQAASQKPGGASGAHT